MSFIMQPWNLFVVILAGWMNRRQQEVIDYLRAENMILKDAWGKKRIRLTDSQRRRLGRDKSRTAWFCQLYTAPRRLYDSRL